MSDRFNTIDKVSEGIFRDRGSKFLAFAHPIRTEEEGKVIVKALWDEYPGICHVCYAYRLGVDGADYRANDDGEPSGSAGLPILNQIKSKDLTNVLVAIARYYGGTKLGVSGLVNAYKEAAKDALENALVVESVLTDRIILKFPHSSIGDVERIINQAKLKLCEQEFGMDCQWQVEVEQAISNEIFARFKTLPNVNVQIK